MSPTEEPPMTPENPMTLRDVTALLRLTLADPAAGARAVLGMGFPREHHWTLFLLAITLSGAVYQATVLILQPEAPEGGQTLPSGFTAAAVTGASVLLLAAAIRWIGKLAGGTGELEQVLLLVIWFQFVLIALQLVEIVVMLIAPFLGAFVFFAFLAYVLWVLTNFIAVVHEFRSLGRVFLGMVLALFALAFLLSLILAPLRRRARGSLTPMLDAAFDVESVRAQFPILSREVQGRPLVYLDGGASAQKPRAVIDAVTRAYSEEYSNVHRGLHTLSTLATERYEAVRGTVARFLGCGERDVILNSGTTEGINTVAYGWAMPRMEAGDEIVLSIMEHHANIVPWHFLRERQGVVLRWVEVDAQGALDPGAVIDAIGPRTRLVAVTHLSNVLGTKVDVAAIVEGAHAKGVPVLVDGSQGAVHMPVDVRALGCDFYAITGHKLYGPSGSGALYVAPERMAEMRPFMGGGDMIREVHRDAITWNDPPMKFEAGTPAIVQQIGLGAALDWMTDLGMQTIAAHEDGPARLRPRAARGAELAQPPGHDARQGRDLLVHARGGGARPRHLHRARQEGRGGARRPPLRAASDGAHGGHGDLPGLLRRLQHPCRGGRARGGAGALPRALRLSLAAPARWGYRGLAGPLAQLDRALPSEGRGQRFESSTVRHPPSPRRAPPPGRSGAVRVAARDPRSRRPQRPQLRTCPQSMWTKLEPVYLPTPPAAQAWAARNIWPTEREESRRSAACPFMCSELRATPRERARSIALVLGDR